MMARICSLSVERANDSDCLRGAYTISKPQIVYALCTKLSWPVKDFRSRLSSIETKRARLICSSSLKRALTQD